MRPIPLLFLLTACVGAVPPAGPLPEPTVLRFAFTDTDAVDAFIGREQTLPPTCAGLNDNSIEWQTDRPAPVLAAASALAGRVRTDDNPRQETFDQEGYNLAAACADLVDPPHLPGNTSPPGTGAPTLGSSAHVDVENTPYIGNEPDFFPTAFDWTQGPLSKRMTLVQIDRLGLDDGGWGEVTLEGEDVRLIWYAVLYGMRNFGSPAVLELEDDDGNWSVITVMEVELTLRGSEREQQAFWDYVDTLDGPEPDFGDLVISLPTAVVYRQEGKIRAWPPDLPQMYDLLGNPVPTERWRFSKVVGIIDPSTFDGVERLDRMMVWMRAVLRAHPALGAQPFTTHFH